MVTIPNEIQWISMAIIFAWKCPVEKLSQNIAKPTEKHKSGSLF